MSSTVKSVTLCEKWMLMLAESCVDPIHDHEIEVVGGMAVLLAVGGFAADGTTSRKPPEDGSSAPTPAEGTRNAQTTAAARRERTGRPS